MVPISKQFKSFHPFFYGSQKCVLGKVRGETLDKIPNKIHCHSLLGTIFVKQTYFKYGEDFYQY